MSDSLRTSFEHHSASENQLVTLSQAGDRDACTELLKRNQALCLKVAFSILKNRQDAEDEVQNALWKAFHFIGQFKQDSQFSTWLSRIVMNQCLIRLRKSRRAQFFYVDHVPPGGGLATLQIKDCRLSPEQELGRAEIARLVQQEVHKIPPLLRTVYLLREVEQLPMPDVAEKLGISVGAAKSRLLRARVELRDRLLPHFGRVGPAMLLLERGGSVRTRKGHIE